MPNVGDDQKILVLRVMNKFNSVANFDRSFLDFEKIKKQNTKDSAIATDIAITEAVKDAAIASGKAITQAVKSESFDEKGDLRTDFSWQDAENTNPAIINQAKLQTAYVKYLKSREAGDKEVKLRTIWSCLTSFSGCFSCLRSGKTKELETKEVNTEEKIKERKIKMKKQISENPNSQILDNFIHAYKLNAILGILDDDNNDANKKIQLLNDLIQITSESRDQFINDFSKNLDFKFKNILPRNFGSNSKNYLEKFCTFVLISDKTPEQKIKALDIFIKELNVEDKDENRKSLERIINSRNDYATIRTRVDALLGKVEKNDGSQIFAHAELNPNYKAPTSTPAPAPVGPAASAAAAAAAATDPAATTR